MELLRTAGRLVDGRIVALGLLTVGLGSPWIQHPLRENRQDNNTAQWLQHILTVPGWQPALAFGQSHTSAINWGENLGLVVLLAGLFLLMPRVVTRAPAGLVRWATALGAGVLTGLLSGLAAWAVVAMYGDLGVSGLSLLPSTLNTSAGFGAVLGAAVGMAYSPTLSGSGARVRLPRTRERSTVMTTSEQHPAPVALGSVPGDVTRYLCAAAYLDPVFSQRVVDELLADEFGAVATSPGVDLVPVARHCLTARHLRSGRDRRLAWVFTALVVIAPLWLLIGTTALGVLGFAARDKSPYRSTRGHDRPDTTTAVWRVCATAVVLFAAGVLVAIGLAALPLPGVLQWLCGAYAYGVPALAATVAALTVAYLIVLRHELDFDARLRSSLRRPVFSPDVVPKPAPEAAWAEDRIETIAEAQRGNVSVYSGYLPYLGYAAENSSWTLSIPLLPAVPHPGQGAGTVTEFDAWEVVTAVRERLAALAAGADGGAGLTGLVLEDRVFVNGAALAGDRRFLEHLQLTPATLLAPDEIRNIALNPEGTVRHYLVSYLPMWGDDVVPTMFLHISTAGQTLHIRAGTHVLSPVHRRYHQVDALPAHSSDDRRRELQLAVLQGTGRTLMGAPAAARAHAASEKRRTRRLLREHQAFERDPAFDYGARLSVREMALGPEYQNYFQPVDATRTHAALNRHTLAAVRDFLDDHGVDTADFRTQQQTILNNGILQQGGVSVVGNQAVGTGAKATVAPTSLTKAAKSPNS